MYGLVHGLGREGVLGAVDGGEETGVCVLAKFCGGSTGLKLPLAGWCAGGVACVYDVFDQQFATFFKSFFTTPEAGTRAFGFATTAGEICNAIIMFCSPWIINRIGAKNTLLIAGMVMAARMIGSSFATTAAEVVALKMLHALEVPFLLVGAFKEGFKESDTRLSATIYLVGFQFAKQVAAIFLSAFAGNMYDRIGFQDTYLILGGIALVVTVISAFTLSGKAALGRVESKAMTT